MKKKIFIISAGRSDYDRYYPIISSLKKTKKAELLIYLTYQNYNKIFSNNVSEIKKEFKVLNNPTRSKNFGDGAFQMIKNLSHDLEKLSYHIKIKKPDIIIIMGDRYEMLLGPLAAIPFNRPTVHFFGGAVTEGAIDEMIRHGLTKMSHIHFVLLNIYKKRLLNLGEENWRIKVIGMPSLNRKKILKTKYIEKNDILKRFINKPFALVTYHPVTLEINQISKQVNSLIRAIKRSKLNAVITYPNSDPKFNSIIRLFKKNFKHSKKILFIKSAGENRYFNLMHHAKLMLGNSSSGIVEAASFKLPVVNIGSRQSGKFKPKNVIDTGYHYKEIHNGIKKALSKSFKKSINKLNNPYESKISTTEIAKMILGIKKNEKLIKKKFKDLKNI